MARYSFGWFFIVASVSLATTVRAAPKNATEGEVVRDRVRIAYRGTPKPYAEALAAVADSARRTYSEVFSLDLPDSLVVQVDVERGNRVAIWDDGSARIDLTLSNTSQLRAPAKSKVSNIYGLCFELADLAVQRTLGECDWLSDAAILGLCHYCASEAIERVYFQHGQRLWPDAYAYQDEGMARFKKQMKDRRPSAVIGAAALWQALTKIVGERALGVTLKAWRGLEVDAKRPVIALGKALPSARDAYHQGKLNDWLKSFSDVALVAADRGGGSDRALQLRKNPVALAYGDGTSDGESCLPEDGHIVQFKTPPGEWYITKLHLYAERFGVPLRKMKYVTITLCDESLAPIKSWEKPYGFFRGAKPRWFHLKLAPARVPEAFAIVVQFFCREDEDTGVRLHRDSASKGHSAVGRPGGPGVPLEDADWMMRVDLDTSERSNPLVWQP